MTSPPDGPAPTVFIGSSSESKRLGQYLQIGLQNSTHCAATLWTQGVFGVSSFALIDLLAQAKRSDFAVLIVAPDDIVERRGEVIRTARDNVIFELGLFFGALGLERTFILNDQSAAPLQLPSDLAGLTFLTYSSRLHSANPSAAVADAVLKLTEKIEELGRRTSDQPEPARSSTPESRPELLTPGETLLQHELAMVCANAQAQGWNVNDKSPTTLRLTSPRGHRHSFSMIERDSDVRDNLRRYVAGLRADGLRVNRLTRRPIDP